MSKLPFAYPLYCVTKMHPGIWFVHVISLSLVPECVVPGLTQGLTSEAQREFDLTFRISPGYERALSTYLFCRTSCSCDCPIRADFDCPVYIIAFVLEVI